MSKRLLVLALLTVCVLLCCACYPAYDLGEMRVDDVASARFIAHRGLNVLGDATLPRNTAASFLAAASSPLVWGIETDVWQTQDGALVCMHDRDAVKGIKDVRAATWQQIVSSPLKDYKDADYYAPSLEEYLSICQKGDKTAVVEIKDKDLDEAGLNAILALARQMEVEIVVISFYLAKIAYLRAQDPALTCMWLVDKNWRKYQRALPYGEGDKTLAGLIDECLLLGIHLDVEHEFLLQHEKANDGWIAAFHHSGLSVGVWTVDSVRTALYFTGVLGVDYVTSNTDMATLVADYTAQYQGN